MLKWLRSVFKRSPKDQNPPKKRQKRPIRVISAADRIKVRQAHEKRIHGHPGAFKLTENGQKQSKTPKPGRFQQTANTSDNALTAFNRVPVSRDPRDYR